MEPPPLTQSLFTSLSLCMCTHQSSHFDRLSIDDFKVENEVRHDFPCLYCYEDFDIVSLCSHLEDEHSCESKTTVCLICSVKVARGMLGHITMQHGHLFKLQRHRRLHRVAVPNSQALSLLGCDLHEAHLQLLGSGGYRSENANVSNAAATDLHTIMSSSSPSMPVQPPHVAPSSASKIKKELYLAL
ncbi:protein DEHYDRATION-INDUCED 19-like [Malus sylvestris]|uniref:Di19 zinc-binding domain-containing protein n=1 Tax=Malus domestica TaxID=3750 RepID=A0A498JDX9_MALDO|nr:protein DEHYDRATION-INDUCED 19-like [Malus domestica]XP_050156245.1 protein DEHYDRATION-INDUCED 19-like [Malus sylvestris]RXH93710.1 hypothetical protein DVH24_014286 [Malus domestica]